MIRVIEIGLGTLINNFGKEGLSEQCFAFKNFHPKMSSGVPWDEDQYTSVGDEAYDLFGPDGFGGSSGKEIQMQQGDQPNYDIRPRPSPTMSFGGGAEGLDNPESLVDTGNVHDGMSGVRMTGQRSWSIGSIPTTNQFPLGGTSYGDQLFREYMHTQRSDGLSGADQSSGSLSQLNASQGASLGVGEISPGRSGMSRRTRGGAASADIREAAAAAAATHRGVSHPAVDARMPPMPATTQTGHDYATLMGARGASGAGESGQQPPQWNIMNMPPQMMALAQGMHPSSGMSIAQMASVGVPPQQPGAGVMSMSASASSSSSSSSSGSGGMHDVGEGGISMGLSFSKATGEGEVDLGYLSDDTSMIYDSGEDTHLSLSPARHSGAGAGAGMASQQQFGDVSPKVVAKKARRGRMDNDAAGAAASVNSSSATIGRGPAGGRAAASSSSSSGAGGLSVSNEVKAKEKNREHAKNTRMRKKTYIESLKDEVRVLSEGREKTENTQRFQLAQKAEQANNHKSTLSTFLAYRTSGEQNYGLWAELLDDDFTMVLPITPYRSFSPAEVCDGSRTVEGIDGVIRDTASVSVMMRSVGLPLNDGSCVSAQFYSLSQETFNSNTRLMCPFYMCTENAMERGAKCEITKYGMLSASFRADEPTKLQSVEMTFDVMAIMQQLRRASGSDEFRVVPNTFRVAADASPHEARVIISAKEPHTIAHVSARWSEIFSYTSEEVIGKDPAILHGPETDKMRLTGMIQQVLSTRPACGFVTMYGGKGKKVCVWLQAYPIFGDGQLSHVLFQMEVAIDSAPAPLPLDRPKTVILDHMTGRLPFPGGVGPSSFNSSSIGSENSPGLPFGWPMSGLEIPPNLAKRLASSTSSHSSAGSVGGKGADESQMGSAGKMNNEESASSSANIVSSTSANSLDQHSRSSGSSAEKDMASKHSSTSYSGSGTTDQDGMGMDLSRSGANSASASSLSEYLEGVFPSSSMGVGSGSDTGDQEIAESGTPPSSL